MLIHRSRLGYLELGGADSSTDDGVLQAIALVELAWARLVESIKLTDRAWPVLVHQSLALALRDGGLCTASGRLVVGPKAERRFGRRNFIMNHTLIRPPQDSFRPGRGRHRLGE